MMNLTSGLEIPCPLRHDHAKLSRGGAAQYKLVLYTAQTKATVLSTAITPTFKMTPQDNNYVRLLERDFVILHTHASGYMRVQLHT